MAKKTSYPMSQRRYVKCGGICCPFCGGGNIEGGPVEIDGGDAWQEITCADCEADWTDHYTLTGYSAPRRLTGRAREIRAASGKGGGQ